MNEMDQWATDTFYSYFPSFRDQIKRKEILAQARQQDYQNYLAQISELASKESKKRTKRKVENIEPNFQTENIFQNHATDRLELEAATKVCEAKASMRQNSPRYKLLEDLKHTDLPNVFHPDSIQERNKELAQETTRKKQEYQKELIKQIEDKKKEVLSLKAKEKKEEELLTKKLEEQLRTMQLEEELSKENSKSEQARITNEQNHIFRMHLLSKLENDHKLYNPYKERKAQSENGKDKLKKSNDAKVYKYFSNSARYAEKPVDDNNSSITESNIDHFTDRNEYCRRCRNSLNEVVCNFCERKRRNLHEDDGYCLKCNAPLNTSNEKFTNLCINCKQTDMKCAFCIKHEDICSSCKTVFCLRCHQRREKLRPLESTTEESSQELELPSRSKQGTSSTYRIFDVAYTESESEHDLNFNPQLLREDNNPYSTNIPKSSVFYANKRIKEPKLAVSIRNGEIFINQTENLDDLRQKNEERIAKYARNYGQLKARRFKISDKATRDQNDDSFPLPLMRENLQKSMIPEKQHIRQSPAIKMLESKWNIPAVQKNSIKAKPTRVLTQLGAIRKQLQLEQLDFDHME